MDVVVKGKRCIDFKGKSYLQGEVIRNMPDKEALRLLKKNRVETPLSSEIDPSQDVDGTEAEMKAMIAELEEKLVIEESLKSEYEARIGVLIEALKNAHARPKAVDEMTIPELKNLLHCLDVQFPSNAQKDDLLKLAKAEIATPQGE